MFILINIQYKSLPKLQKKSKDEEKVILRYKNHERNKYFIPIAFQHLLMAIKYYRRDFLNFDDKIELQ